MDKIFRFWLFNDMLIYGSSNGGTYTFNRAIELWSINLSEYDDNSKLPAMELLSAKSLSCWLQMRSSARTG